MDMLAARASSVWQALQRWGTSADFYTQLGAAALAVALALLLAILLRRRLGRLEPAAGARPGLASVARRLDTLLFPTLAIVALGVAIELNAGADGRAWLLRAIQLLAVILLLYRIISEFVTSPFVAALLKWIAIPLAALRVFGWLDEVTAYLAAHSLDIGNISVSALALARTLIFGSVLFWLGRASSALGKQAIRSRETIDVATREVVSKLFEISLYVLIFLILLGVMGINLTALAVFGGALGVGLGFGLQSIASNFISGIIILLDRSLTIGDYVEFDDGRTGTLRELNMRSATLETFDGKDIMVPNEQFITSSFVNWTHKNKKQRYSLEFSVAYETDLHAMLDIVRDVVASHPKVLTGDDLPVEERPDAEIASFGDSGVNILVEFWMYGIDDGENRVGADLLLMIWDALKEHDIVIPFPQRDVHLVQRE